jgi:hypothetical protein
MEPQVLLNMSKDFLRRNNPVTLATERITSLVYYWWNYNSMIKLSKFRFMLMQQQLRTMEQNVADGDREARGYKLDRSY